MSNLETRIEPAIAMIAGPVAAGNLLEEIKLALLNENVFKKLFDNTGKRIFVNEMPNYNVTIIPFLELYWGRDTSQSWDTYLTGTITGRIGLPAKFRGNADVQKKVGNALIRFFGNKSCRSVLHPTVPGLIELGVGMTAEYDKLLQFDAITIPVINFTIPYKIDLHMMELASPAIDFRDNLDAQEVPDFESYTLNLVDDLTNILLEGEVPFEDE